MKLLIQVCLLALLGLFTNATFAEIKPLAELVNYPQRSAPASVIARHNTPLVTEVSGVVEKLEVEVGDRVEAGQLLLALEPFTLQQQLNQQQALLDSLVARIELAEFQLQQAQRLAKQSNVSEELLRTRQAELATLKADHQAQQASFALAKYRLRKSELRAPFAGVVVERHAQLGGYLSANVVALQLLSDQQQQLRADLSMSAMSSWDSTTEFEFWQGDQKFAVQMQSLLPVLEGKQRTQQARFRFLDRQPLVGSSGRLVWKDKRPHLAAEHILRRSGRLGIYLMHQDGAEFLVLPDASEGRAVAVDQLSLQQQLVLGNDLPEVR